MLVKTACQLHQIPSLTSAAALLSSALIMAVKQAFSVECQQQELTCIFSNEERCFAWLGCCKSAACASFDHHDVGMPVS